MENSSVPSAYMIPNCKPFLTGNELKYLKEAIETEWLSSTGPFVDRLEDLFANYHGVSAAAAVSSGTAAIHLGLISIGVRTGDLVLCPTLTFIGSANPIHYCGADPVFLDIEKESLNLDPKCLENFLQSKTERRYEGIFHKQSGRRIAALIVVHLYGNPAPLEPILELCREYNLPVLEDAAESLGARYKGRLVGTIGDIGCFSLNGNKVITSGGGGIVISRNAESIEQSKHLSTQAKIDKFEFNHDEVGFNYRLSNLCAAVGVAQMEHLNSFIERKRKHATQYKTAFGQQNKWEILQEPKECQGTYWMTLARTLKPNEESILDKIRSLSQKGIGFRPLWRPLHTLPIFRNSITHGGIQAEKAYHSTFCLPSSVGLSEEEINKVVEALTK